ncbi:MAG: MBOAT family O-acyltransferase [Clostridia bacterium]|nr:MBOAT family O-acyltransferase [Clostridia bacterium]
MSFDSLDYLLFLPLVTLLHWLCPHRARWAVLLGASLVFYASWNPSMTLLLLSVIAVSYTAGLMLNKSRNPRARKGILVLSLLLCAGFLLYFKYFHFLAGTAESVVRMLGSDVHFSFREIILPVGLSFYTFQAMSYVIDVYRGTLPAETHPGYYALYISFFPQLVAGPIERAGGILKQLKQRRVLSKEDARMGLRLLLSGFFRKIVIADCCARFVDAAYSLDLPDGSAVFLATILFSFQIYCDFSGYSEIAAGSARLLGIRLSKNFDQPYLAPGIREFWRRWHITLSRWFQDYVYIPLGGNRKGIARQTLALWTVFLLSGLWHGADWSFVLWGALHGVFMTAELWLSRHSKRKIPDAVSIGLTYLLVTFSWVFFRAASVSHAFALIQRLFSPWSIAAGWAVLGMNGLDALWILLALSCLPLLRQLANDRIKSLPAAVYAYCFLAIALAFWMRLDANMANAFIYFQF